MDQLKISDYKDADEAISKKFTEGDYAGADLSPFLPCSSAALVGKVMT